MEYSSLRMSIEEEEEVLVVVLLVVCEGLLDRSGVEVEVEEV